MLFNRSACVVGLTWFQLQDCRFDSNPESSNICMYYIEFKNKYIYDTYSIRLLPKRNNVAIGNVVVCEIKRKIKLLYQNSFNKF